MLLSKIFPLRKEAEACATEFHSVSKKVKISMRCCGRRELKKASYCKVAIFRTAQRDIKKTEKSNIVSHGKFHIACHRGSSVVRQSSSCYGSRLGRSLTESPQSWPIVRAERQIFTERFVAIRMTVVNSISRPRSGSPRTRRRDHDG